MSKVGLVINDKKVRRALKSVAADVERLLLATVDPHIEFTIGPITKQEQTKDGNSHSDR